MSAWANQIQSFFGTTRRRSCSIFTGSVRFVRPNRPDNLVTWVSTTIPEAIPYAVPSTTFAVFLPTPASAVISSIVFGTWPPCLSTRARQHEMMDRALFL